MYLVHHGIKGQKWGVRRFQNADGSFTAEGREHYGRSRKKTDTSNFGDVKVAKSIQGGLTKDKAIGKSLKAVNDINSSTKSLAKMREKYKSRRMSDEELQSAIDAMVAEEDATRERRALENRYQELRNRQINTGREFVEDAISAIGSVGTAVTAAATLYILMRDVTNR